MEPMSEIGSYEAKTHLPELLRSVGKGKRFTITHRGKPVAELVPVGTASLQNAARAAAEMIEFMTLYPPETDVDLKALVAEGRD